MQIKLELKYIRQCEKIQKGYLRYSGLREKRKIMGANILKIEKLDNIYFDNRNVILTIWIIISIIASIYMLIKLKQSNSVNGVAVLGKATLNVVIIGIVGLVINVAGLNLNFSVDYMSFLIFVAAVLITFLIKAAECIKYRKNCGTVVKSAARIIGYIIECELLLLIIAGRLECIEFFGAWIGFMALKLLEEYIEKTIEEKYETINSPENNRVDCPIMHEEDLFDGRKNQLDSLIRELGQFSGEPFAVVISGEWGSGKTSLVNILRDKMEKTEFVEVQCGIDYDVKGILNDLAIQIQDVFEKNRFYTGRNSKISQYFVKIGELVDAVGYSTVSKIINRISKGENITYLESKKRINQELNAFYKLTEKRIIIIVDDMDRIVDDKMRALIFTVIRESVTLNNCCTLFMVDYEKLISDYLSREFLEKYVNRHIELSTINFKEIVEHYLNNYLTQEFWADKNAYVREKEAEAKHKILTKAEDVLLNLEKQIESTNENAQNRNEENNRDEEANRQIKILIDAELRLQTRTTNPRKVKRFLDSIEKNITIADILWFQKENSDRDRNEYSQENWVAIICQVAFLQTFFAEEYNAVLSAKSLVNLKRDHEHSMIVENVIDGYRRCSIGNNKEEIIEKIIYQLYALNIETDKTIHQQLLEEIDQGRLREEHLTEYINECLGRDLDFSRMKKILDYLEDNQNRYSGNLNEAVLNLVELISHNRNFGKEGYIGILKRIKKLVDIYKLQGAFNPHQINLLEHYIQILQTSVIFQNVSNMTYILNVVFDTRISLDDIMNIDSIDKLYRFVVNENKENSIEEVVSTEAKLDSLHNYIYALQNSIQREEYSYAKESLQYFMDKVLNMLKILEIWFGQEGSSEREKKILRSVDFNSEVLGNSDELLHALSMFKESIKKYADNKKNGERFIQLAFDIEKVLIENSNCYGNDGKAVVQELCNIYELLQKDEETMLHSWGDQWRYVQIRLFQLRRIVGISNE